ncbi:UNVERIFIED_CONTAM: hypothetical protein Sangu_2440900 [Sesamum angustifolium]|uniref:Uncharacterized protein n=1 Tax=Sesamum angustifolium TaxID=2727405 RepID=A0AAW2KWW6_9LAMI
MAVKPAEVKRPTKTDQRNSSMKETGDEGDQQRSSTVGWTVMASGGDSDGGSRRYAVRVAVVCLAMVGCTI